MIDLMFLEVENDSNLLHFIPDTICSQLSSSVKALSIPVQQYKEMLWLLLICLLFFKIENNIQLLFVLSSSNTQVFWEKIY